MNSCFFGLKAYLFASYLFNISDFLGFMAAKKQIQSGDLLYAKNVHKHEEETQENVGTRF
jgi:hypothetical protein